MPWGRVDDTYYDHAKVRKLPRPIRNAASGLYWRAISLCNRQMTDGVLTQEDIDLIDGTPEEVQALVRAGLLERHGKRWQVHDYLEFNKSRAEIIALREKLSEAGRSGGLASGRARAEYAKDRARNRAPRGAKKPPPSDAEGQASPTVLPPSRPVPSRPVPSGALPNGSAPTPGAPPVDDDEGARYGMPHVDDAVRSEAETIVGRSLSTLHGTWAGELDRLVEQRGSGRVVAAMKRAAGRYGADRPSWAQLVASVRNDLEPLPAANRQTPTVETPAERFAREREELAARIAREGGPTH